MNNHIAELETDARESVDLAALDDLAGFLVRMIQLRMFQSFHDRFASTGFSPGLLCALVAIGGNPGVRAGALGDALLIRRSNMTKLVDALEQRGLVRRLASDQDRRSVELSLTAAGREAVARIMPQVVAYEDEMLAPLSVHERRIFLGLLGKLNAGMETRSRLRSRPNPKE
jgi:DNA-binding MarR family transcriptional regulator